MRSGSEPLRRYLEAQKEELQRGRARAFALNRTEPGWWCYFSASQRTLVAMPLWDPGRPVVLTSPDEQALRTSMRTLEQEHTAPPAWPSGPPANRTSRLSGEARWP